MDNLVLGFRLVLASVALIMSFYLVGIGTQVAVFLLRASSVPGLEGYVMLLLAFVVFAISLALPWLALWITIGLDKAE